MQLSWHGLQPSSEKAGPWPPLSGASPVCLLCTFLSLVQCGVTTSSSEVRGWGGAAFVPHLPHQRSGMARGGPAGLAVPQSTAPVRWVQPTATVLQAGKPLRASTGLWEGLQGYPQGYGHRHPGRVRTLCSAVGLGQSQCENPFWGGILRLSTRPLFAGQEGPQQPQLSSSQFLPNQSVYLLPPWLHV